MCQVFGELHFAGSCAALICWGITICRVCTNSPTCGVSLPQAIVEAPVFCQDNGEFQFAGSCFAQISWGITTCRSESGILRKRAKSLDDCGSSCTLDTPLHVAIPAHHRSYTCPFLLRFRAHHHIPETPPIMWRVRSIIFLKHALSFGDPGSSYIFDTPFHVTIPVHHISSARPLLWRCPFIIISIS